MFVTAVSEAWSIDPAKIIEDLESERELDRRIGVYENEVIRASVQAIIRPGS
jgi:hypothetical protein